MRFMPVGRAGRARFPTPAGRSLPDRSPRPPPGLDRARGRLHRRAPGRCAAARRRAAPSRWRQRPVRVEQHEVVDPDPLLLDHHVHPHGGDPDRPRAMRGPAGRDRAPGRRTPAARRRPPSGSHGDCSAEHAVRSGAGRQRFLAHGRAPERRKCGGGDGRRAAGHRPAAENPNWSATPSPPQESTQVTTASRASATSVHPVASPSPSRPKQLQLTGRGGAPHGGSPGSTRRTAAGRRSSRSRTRRRRPAGGRRPGPARRTAAGGRTRRRTGAAEAGAGRTPTRCHAGRGAWRRR